MKKLNYFNKELKDNVDFTTVDDGTGNMIPRDITEDDYEIKALSIQVEDKDLNYYTDIITTSYGAFGELTVEEGAILPPTVDERVASMETMITMLMGV